jgi:hypothetical protein
MAGRGPAPDPFRIRRNVPARGDWTPAPEGGWVGRKPRAPKGLSPATVRVWDGWFRSWWAGHWTSDDLPQLRIVIRLYDRVRRGDVKRAAELRQWLDAYGLSPKGRQDRRWAPPVRPATNPLLDYIAKGRRPRDDGPSMRERLRAIERDEPDPRYLLEDPEWGR